MSLHDLLPTLSQIFLTIKLGWLAGTFNIIKAPEARGLNIFVGKYSLPSLVFISLATIDFSTVNLAFLLGVFASKLLIFLSGALRCGMKITVKGTKRGSLNYLYNVVFLM